MCILTFETPCITERYMMKVGLQNGENLYCRNAQRTALKGIFCGRDIVLQNKRYGGRVLIKMFCYVTVKKTC